MTFTQQILVLILILLCQFVPSQTVGDELAHVGTNVNSTAYFAQMPFRESPFADLRGIHPISEQQAANYNHFRFLYDAYGRPIEISFRLGNRVRDLNLSANALTFAPVTRIRYRDGQEIRTFFDKYMNPTTGNGDTFSEVYEYDRDGNRSTLSFLDIEGQSIDNGWGIARYEWSVSRDGTVTENRFNLKGEAAEIRPGFPFYCLKLHYDQNGWLALMENYGKTCQELTQNELNAAQDKLQYTAGGDMYAWNVYDSNEQRSEGNSPRVARGLRGFDALGQDISERYEDAQGKPMTNAYGWTQSKAEFDEYGNMIQRFNYDLAGQLAVNEQLGYAGYEMEFDEDGMNRLVLRYLDEQLRPAVHKTRGYHEVRTGFDANGDLERIQYLGVNGESVNRLDNGIGTIERRYDDKHRLVSVELFDKDLQPIRHAREDWHRSTYIYHSAGPLIRIERS